MPLFGGHRSYFGAVGLFLGNGSTASWQIPVEKACEYLDRMGEFQASSAATELACLPIPTGLYVSGAEPFAQIDDLERLLDCALRNRMLAELVTTVSWVDSQGTANSVIERFAKKVHLLTVVTSQADSERYGLARLEHLLGALREFDINTSIRCSIGPGEPFPREVLALEVVNCDTSVIRVEPRAGASADGAEWPAGYLLPAPPRYARCAELMGFVIVPGGDVYPCSSGIGFSQLRLGNIEAEPIESVVRRTMADAALRKLHDKGPYYLYELCSESADSARLAAGDVSACQFHRHVLADPKLVAVAASANTINPVAGIG